jgi:adenine-specific DNA methylase
MTDSHPTNNDLRLIEDYIPIEAISAEARREKSIRKGHISTLHLWWARRPLVVARAAVFGQYTQQVGESGACWGGPERVRAASKPQQVGESSA